ncbi:DMT family transporter [Desulfovibrio litoralis]|uniref:Permease of the drug/metabolite transporter (DMT) superfamily n=1 Tax=Desulfovibrio litoralis DSM 11393 TaxID=1121455 RepID=A0A1M7RV88_9BACT|nr:DMT family transporter [Desulfovibrio litoralis]SHN50183.1 Permease of the drug/metabolite transporter (DMT) superfamily [Desulfovibrio litoralis DSM 11393]
MIEFRKLEGFIMALAAVIIWSGNIIVAKQLAPDISPFSLSLLRWSSACFFLAPFGLKPLLKDWKIIRQHLGFHLTVSFFGISLSNALIYYAAHDTSGVNMVIIASTAPMMTMILGCMFLKETLNFGKVIGALLAFSGIIAIASRGDLDVLIGMRFSWGDGLALIASFLFAVYSILLRFIPKGVSQLGFLSAIFFMGALWLIPMTAVELYLGGTIYIRNWQSIAGIAYAGAGSSVACFFLWNEAIKKIGPFKVSMIYYSLPVFGCLWAILFLGERLMFMDFVGGALVLVGVLTATIASRR